ncbi:hypothetical protein BDN70DRAFT_900851 [Pholiota conissans]|uniref:Uncharacterized protein n=1 Tax=Pholiota conissans TaxID=109636 RepID=A0A9P6CMR5_9AGAR|nr:hypothetical protein BDN70DRAFT_900851 [Pholiota conissans]
MPLSNVSLPSTPAGFATGVSPDGHTYIVPEFMLPALLHGFETIQRQADLNVANGNGDKLAQFQNLPFHVIGHGSVLYPADPPLSDREWLSLHAQVVALQEQFGISYKDAAHRLYFVYVNKVNLHTQSARVFESIETRMQKTLVEIGEKFDEIEGHKRHDHHADDMVVD